jgi:putative transposase
MFHKITLRLRGYDYSSAGIYFVTICSQKMISIFGMIENGQMELNQFGEIVNNCWLAVPDHFNEIILDEYFVMPNHFHGLVIIGEKNYRCEVTSYL